MLRLGSPGEQQLDLLPGNVTGIPHGFHYHPFRFIDWKEEARIQKQAAQRSAERTTDCKRRFYMDFGFMRASATRWLRRWRQRDIMTLAAAWRRRATGDDNEDDDDGDGDGAMGSGATGYDNDDNDDDDGRRRRRRRRWRRRDGQRDTTTTAKTFGKIGKGQRMAWWLVMMRA